MNQTDWIAIAAVVSAVSTVVLTIVTCVYVYLTHRLVRVQEHPVVGIRLQAQELATRSLVSTVVSSQKLLVVLCTLFPLDLAKEPSSPAFESLNLIAIAGELFSAIPQLSQAISILCLKAARELNAAASNMRALEVVISTEKAQAAVDNRAWSWDEARKTYLTTIRQRIVAKPEWEDIASGKAGSDALRSLEALYLGIMQYLKMPG